MERLLGKLILASISQEVLLHEDVLEPYCQNPWLCPVALLPHLPELTRAVKAPGAPPGLTASPPPGHLAACALVLLPALAASGQKPPLRSSAIHQSRAGVCMWTQCSGATWSFWQASRAPTERAACWWSSWWIAQPGKKESIDDVSPLSVKGNLCVAISLEAPRNSRNRTKFSLIIDPIGCTGLGFCPSFWLTNKEKCKHCGRCWFPRPETTARQWHSCPLPSCPGSC